MKNVISVTISGFLTTIVYYLGGMDMALKTLLLMMLLDYITGLCKAIVNKRINSLIGVKGIVKKVGYLVIVSLSFLLDEMVGDNGAIRNLVIYFFVANEGISILENWGGMGLPLPKKVFEVLEQIKKEKEGE